MTGRNPDSTTDILNTSYIAGVAAPETNLSRYLFMDARQGTYHGNTAAVFVRYIF